MRHPHILFLLLAVVGLLISQACEIGEYELLQHSKKGGGDPLDPLGPTPCDNYGFISPLLQTLHKTLYRACASSCKISDQLPESLCETLQEANKKRCERICELRDRLSIQVPITI